MHRTCVHPRVLEVWYMGLEESRERRTELAYCVRYTWILNISVSLSLGILESRMKAEEADHLNEKNPRLVILY